VTAVFTFIAGEQATTECRWSTAEMCRTLAVSRSGYHDWVDRSPSDREVIDRMFDVEIEASRARPARLGPRGSPAWLRRQSFAVSGKRLAGLMRRNSWEG
jgi:hypothetical protein